MTIEMDKFRQAEQKAADKERNIVYFERQTWNLLWDRSFTSKYPKWDHTTITDPDWFNKSTTSIYPNIYNESIHTCAKIFGGNVRFYNYDDYLKTISAKVSDFPSLDLPKFYGKTGDTIPIIPSGTYIDIIKTITHHRKDKKTGEIYCYVMCQVRVNEEYNTADISDKIRRGTIGFIWHTFMSPYDPLFVNSQKGVCNIGYVFKPGIPVNNSIEKPLMDYYNNSIPFPNKANPEFTINFVTKSTGNRNANCMNKVKKTHPVLFDTLYYAGKNSNVPEINVGYLDYGSGISHPEGRACDIWSIIVDENGKNETYKYRRDYSNVESKWLPFEEPAGILNFEQAFKEHGNSENVWGPWLFYTGNAAAIPNVIDIYPGLANVTTDYKDEDELMEKIETFVNNLNGTDTYKKLKDHWIHRNHGHFSVKHM